MATQGRSHTSKKLFDKGDGNLRRSPLSQRNLNLASEASAPRRNANADLEGDAGANEQDPREAVDHQQKNLERLEALKAKKAQEVKDMENEREKTKRRQEKLKNMILREAEENRKKKAEREKEMEEE